MWAGIGFCWPRNYYPWNHARGMSKLAFLCSEPCIIYGLMSHLYISSILQAHVFRSPSGCAAFLANYNSNSYAKVVFNNENYNLPPWSISILPDCKNVVFNSATVSFTCIFVSVRPIVLFLHFTPFIPQQLYDTWLIWLKLFLCRLVFRHLKCKCGQMGPPQWCGRGMMKRLILCQLLHC